RPDVIEFPRQLGASGCCRVQSPLRGISDDADPRAGAETVSAIWEYHGIRRPPGKQLVRRAAEQADEEILQRSVRAGRVYVAAGTDHRGRRRREQRLQSVSPKGDFVAVATAGVRDGLQLRSTTP